MIKPSSLGDIVHGLQVLQTASRARPELRISWVVRERFAGLVQAAPFVDEAILFHRRGGGFSFCRLLLELRRRRFDAVWDMQGLLRSALMTAAAGATVKWGRPDAREGAGYFYDRVVTEPAGPGPHHAIEVLRPFLQTVDVERDIERPLELRPAAVYPWHGFFAGDPRATFVVFTDSRGEEKKWPHYPALLERILATVPGSRVAWCAGKKTPTPARLPAERLLNLTGCPLDEMIALVRQPAVFVGNDSGPMHLAAAVGNRVLAIFGPTSPRRFGPYPLEAAKHLALTAPEGTLARLEPAAVLAALNELRGRS